MNNYNQANKQIRQLQWQGLALGTKDKKVPQPYRCNPELCCQPPAKRFSRVEQNPSHCRHIQAVVGQEMISNLLLIFRLRFAPILVKITLLVLTHFIIPSLPPDCLRSPSSESGSNSGRAQGYTPHPFFKKITYLLVTPRILFFCIAETTPAVKRSDDKGA